MTVKCVSLKAIIDILSLLLRLLTIIQAHFFASSSVKLESAAIVEGNIYYNNLEVEKGATVSGSLVREAPTSNVSSISQSEQSVLDGASKSIPGKK